MLSKLLKTIKSERSEQSSANQKKQPEQDPISENKQPITSFKLSNQFIEQLGSQNSQVKGKTNHLPSIINQVISCPISVFHLLPHGQRKVKQIDLTKHPLPLYLQFMEPLLQKQLPTFNHLLINDYPKGIGIMPHGDGPAYLPKVVVLSLGSYCLINFNKAYSSQSQIKSQQQQPKDDHNLVCRLLLEPNSIHIFEEQAYTEHLHGIENYAIDSILLKYNQDQKRVVNANIANYHLLECKHKIESIIQNMNESKQSQQVQSQVEMGDMRIIILQQNSEFTHKLQIRRRERVSITIREQYKAK